jgi:hypothetical protein
MSQAIKLDGFAWVVTVDDDEPVVLVTLGSGDDATGASVWFDLDGEAAQEMGSALIRAYGVLMRRAHSLGPGPRVRIDVDTLNGEVDVIEEEPGGPTR